MSDTPRKILDKEVAAAVAISPRTLNRWKREGLALPRWPRTLAECVWTVGEWRRGLSRSKAVK